MTRHAGEAVWEKPQGKRPPQRMTKKFTVVPRGVALVIGCNTLTAAACTRSIGVLP
jgi:hypothetical protein